MIDIPKGRVAYAVLSFGGVLGIGSKLFAVPWSVLKVDEDEKCFVLDLDKSILEKAPGFDKNNWPDMSDTIWGSEIFSYYHVRPYWEEAGQKTLGGSRGNGQGPQRFEGAGQILRSSDGAGGNGYRAPIRDSEVAR